MRGNFVMNYIRITIGLLAWLTTAVLLFCWLDAAAESDPQFRLLVQRGTEWAATGKVTVPIPDDFPTADKVSSRPY